MFSAYYNTIFPFNEGKEAFFRYIIDKYKPISALDLGCATGELSTFLNSNGCNTIGVDLSPDLISLAKKNPGDYILADINKYLENKTKQKYDLIVCIGNTLPHLEPNELRRFAKEISNWLNQDGLLIIQTVNYYNILRHKPTGLPTIENTEAGVKFTRLYSYNPDASIAFTAMLDSPQGRAQSTVSLWPFTPTELKQLLPDSLGVEGEYGSFSMVPYSPEQSAAWVLVAKYNSCLEF